MGWSQAKAVDLGPGGPLQELGNRGEVGVRVVACPPVVHAGSHGFEKVHGFVRVGSPSRAVDGRGKVSSLGTADGDHSAPEPQGKLGRTLPRLARSSRSCALRRQTVKHCLGPIRIHPFVLRPVTDEGFRQELVELVSTQHPEGHIGQDGLGG